jgi:peptidoglycan/LPS O-acetylase OafA/YrhL
VTEPIAVDTEASIPDRAGRPAGRSRAKVRVTELDLLRFAAAAAVMLYHFTYRLRLTGGPEDVYPSLGRVTMHGHLGVDLFFMISGFVILWTARDRRPSEFVVSRIARLYPEFWICVILSAVAFASVGVGAITIPMVAANLTMIPAVVGQPYVDGIYWTLFVELKFYGLLWVLSLARQMPRIEIWIYLWLVVTLYCALFDAPHLVQSASIYPFSPLFIAGCLFYLIRAEGPTLPRVIGVLACLAMATTQVVVKMPGFVQPPDITATTRFETQAIMASCFALFALVSLRRRSDVPLASFIAGLGMLTYPLYLVHNTAKHLILVPMAGSHRFLALACAVALSIGLAALLGVSVNRYWRRPFLDWLTRLLVRPLPGEPLRGPRAASG